MHFKSLLVALVILLISMLTSHQVWADTQSDIAYLLEYVTNSQCEYERNGTRHNAKEAAEHIQKKYEYYQDDIHSVEDFIRLAATGSKITGNAYLVYCPGKKVITSAEWLHSAFALKP